MFGEVGQTPTSLFPFNLPLPAFSIFNRYIIPYQQLLYRKARVTHTNGTTEAIHIFFWNIDSDNDGITYLFSFYTGLRLLETCDGDGILLDSVMAASVGHCVGSIAPSFCVHAYAEPVAIVFSPCTCVSFHRSVLCLEFNRCFLHPLNPSRLCYQQSLNMVALPMCCDSARLISQWLGFRRTVIVGKTRIIVVKKQILHLHSCRRWCVVVKLAEVVIMLVQNCFDQR
jgi:hypothetical protein